MSFLDFFSKRNAYNADDREFFSITVFAYLAYAESLTESTLDFIKEQLTKDPNQAAAFLSFSYMKGAAVLDVLVIAEKTVSIIENKFDLHILNDFPHISASIKELQLCLNEIGEGINDVSRLEACNRINFFVKTMLRIYDRKDDFYACARAITEYEA
jgi:hypothetical protein|nr:MAG TPA_asm: hypothetical protein [Caudoviricetes sp.]